MNVLRNIGDPSFPLPPGHFQQIFPIKSNRTISRGIDAQDVLKQGRPLLQLQAGTPKHRGRHRNGKPVVLSQEFLGHMSDR